MRLRNLFEALGQEVAIIFGRFNPPHKGHRAAWELASRSPIWFVGTNKSTQGPKDPLPFDVKVEAMKTIWPEVEGHIVAETSWLTLASRVYEQYPNATLLCLTDEDWVTKTIVQYNGKEGAHGFYNFKKIEQKPTPRLSSATALRDAVSKGDRDAFTQAAGVDADTPVAGKPFFDLVAEYLLPYANAPKKAPAKKKKEPAVAEASMGSLMAANKIRQDKERLSKPTSAKVDNSKAQARDAAWWKAQDDAYKAGKDTFKFGGKTYPLKGKGVAEDKDPCWKGYKQIGMKKKGGKQVPNCVPRGSKIAERLSTQDKFEKNLKKHGYDVAEKGKYWDQKVKDIDAQIAAWDQEMERRKKGVKESQLSELDVKSTLNFIKKAHADQLYGDKPYFTHPKAVAATGKKFFGSKFNNDAIKVAFLHDVVEDTNFSIEQLSKMGFTPEVVEAVSLLTKNKALSYADNIKNIINSGNRLAMMVKYADNYQNFTGDKSDFDPDRADRLQKKYLSSLNMLGAKLGIAKHETQPAEDAAGVGIITKQNTTADVNKGTLRKMMKGYHLTDSLEETLENDEFYETYGILEYKLEEAEYQGRTVTLNKPMRGDVKKFKVFVKDPSTGNVKKVNFGDPNMKIKAYDPDRRRSFRARHNCDNPGPKTKARYWSCRKW